MDIAIGLSAICAAYLIYRIIYYSGKCDHRYDLKGITDLMGKGTKAYDDYEPRCVFCKKTISETDKEDL